MPSRKLNRREFVKTATGAGLAIGALQRTAPANARTTQANSRINLGIIGVGGRGRAISRWAIDTGKKPETPAQMVAVCDVYVKRRKAAEITCQCAGIADYKE